MINIPVKDSVAEKSWVNAAQYEAMYDRSISDPDGFWARWRSVLTGSSLLPRSKTNFEDVSIKWFEDGTLNVASTASTATSR